MFDPLSVGIGVGGSILSGIFGQSAADKQSDAARDAAKIQAEATNRGIDLQQQQFAQTRSDLNPFRQAGTGALSTLQSQLGAGAFDTDQRFNPFQQFQQSQGLPQFEQFGIDPLTQFQQNTQPFQFDPDSDPGFQFRLQQGTDAIEGSAAARGGLFSGQTGKDLTSFGQNLASQEFQNAFNRDLAQKDFARQSFGDALGQNLAQQQAGFGQDLAGRQFGSQEFFNALNADTSIKQNAFNRLFGLAGAGQNAAAQTGQFGQNAAQIQAQLAQQGAAAQGAGIQQSAAAQAGAQQNFGNQLSGLAGTALNYNLYKSLLGA
ncbi:MAG: hypothetical protein GY928_20645 [Colwellia sp.]|nr:hypothetical protein [Colwellia sp.]